MGTKRISIFVIIAVLLFAGGFGVRSLTDNTVAPQSAFQINSEKYPLLARRIFIENPNDTIIDFEPLRHQMEDYYTQNNLGGSAYFEYLPTGTSIRVSGDDEEVAASLFKLPAAMDLYKAAEMGKVNLDKEIELKPEWLDSEYGDLYQKGAGYKLTIREAAQIMLEKSDNTALKAVAASTPSDLAVADRSYSAVDVDFTQNKDLTISISARSYSSFLKCLYFSCYNNYGNSQEILEYLTKSDFNDRLVAGIEDKDIKVAHKIGVNSEKNQSDCGIIYMPQRNYVLCAMVAGHNDATTNEHIAAISKMAYDYLKK